MQQNFVHHSQFLSSKQSIWRVSGKIKFENFLDFKSRHSVSFYSWLILIAYCFKKMSNLNICQIYLEVKTLCRSPINDIKTTANFLLEVDIYLFLWGGIILVQLVIVFYQHQKTHWIIWCLDSVKIYTVNIRCFKVS